MILNKKFFLELFLTYKKSLLSHKLYVILLVSLFAGGMVYLKQRAIQKQSVQQKIAQLKNLGADYSQIINEMQAHIESLSSRIKYLSIDNKRLSATGQKLSQQLNLSNSKISKKLFETKKLQLELASIDYNIIRNYENFLAQQEVFINLKAECNKSKDKDKKCLNYAVMKEKLEVLGLELKSQKNKREVLLSQIARFNASL